MSKKKKAIAKTAPMRVLEEKGIPYEYHQHQHKQFTAEGVAQDLGVPLAVVVKAMIVRRSRTASPTDSEFALVVIPGDKRLSLKKVGAALGDKDVKLASERDAQRVTGFQIGAVSVIGFRRSNVPGYVDRRVLELDRVIISAGNPKAGLGLTSQDLLKAIDGAQVGDFCEG
ncbi:MAG TPA: YbaK/EbsC family protein [Anaerolineae bacterium]|nr:YbaK/EbsC family protein [Anaerolineae bacterium]